MKATRKSSSKSSARSVRELPMFFQGRQQSPNFAKGAWAACDLMRKLEEYEGSVGETTAALADEFTENVEGGDYSRGFVTAMVECLAFSDRVGSPSLEEWRPLEMELRYTKRGAHPTPGSQLFDYQGVPVSIAPDLTVHAWGEDPVPDQSILESVLTKGRPLSQRAFDALLAKTVAKMAKIRLDKKQRARSANG